MEGQILCKLERPLDFLNVPPMLLHLPAHVEFLLKLIEPAVKRLGHRIIDHAGKRFRLLRDLLIEVTGLLRKLLVQILGGDFCHVDGG
jgi:hypothetical protein